MRQNPFAETGAASSVTRLLDKYGSSIEGIDDQRTLTPFQRQVIDAAEAWEARKQRERQEEMQQQHSSGRTPNARSPSQASNTHSNDGDRIRYVNKNELPDHPAHQD